ncbi:hypothetical protein DFH08DRAFT_974675 [Mycena albidolilacea]|uniref:Uncharacterized protein n=1 Tax=Mycena albidolilacea TaxID=1033008 RepID=A0AAD6Z794_9AGAR|nr:hypothetical protein DFH08DRAFT_974675 [Mycena albidolilacea]
MQDPALFPASRFFVPSLTLLNSDDRDQGHRPLKPNHPRARDFAALGDAQTSSRCPKHSEGISLHSIQGAPMTIWWLPPQRLLFSARTASTSDSHGIPNGQPVLSFT